MGTSKRRINRKIKEILNKTNVDELNQNAPVITRLSLSTDILSETFQQEFLTSNTLVFIEEKFNSLSFAGFKGKNKEELANDVISKEEFINSILESIENQYHIDSKILIKSLKITIAKFIEGEFDILVFAHQLFFEVVFQILISDLQETLKDSYEKLTYGDIKKMVTSSTECIINQTVYTKISDFVNNKASLPEVLELIHEQTSDALFGEF